MTSNSRKRVVNRAKKNQHKKLQHVESTTTQEPSKEKSSIFPSIDTAFKAFLSARFCSAIWSHISDCDETYNYWEPSHFLLFGKGFQTWEYSPLYGLRSYMYILCHVVPAWIYSNLLQPNRMLIFYFMRCLLGLGCALCESFFYKAVCQEFGIQVGRLVLSFLVFSPGMFISGTAFLPSSFSMYMCLLATGAWYRKKYELAIFCTALSTFLSWPFSALLGLPIAVDMLLLRKDYSKFLQWSAISTIVILGPMVKVDSDMFGRLVVAPLNIVKYNVFSKHGPNLYGTQPASFYFVNGFLNFNFIFVASISTPVMILLRNYLVRDSKKCFTSIQSWLFIAPFYIWLLVFTAQPHKEERFLFPVYPLICLCGAVSVSALQSIWSALTARVSGRVHSNLVTVGVILLSALFGTSRVFALYRGYHAPMDVYMELNKLYMEEKVPSNMAVHVCVGKEWHRFPTSFFLPNDNWSLKFVQSEFKGQLPAEFSSFENATSATSAVHQHFNDENLEEHSRYFDIDKCHFLVDCDYGKSTELEPNYSRQSDRWSVVTSLPFLHSERSNKFFRAFYIPFMSDNYCVFASYSLLRATKFKLKEDDPSAV